MLPVIRLAKSEEKLKISCCWILFETENRSKKKKSEYYVLGIHALCVLISTRKNCFRIVKFLVWSYTMLQFWMMPLLQLQNYRITMSKFCGSSHANKWLLSFASNYFLNMFLYTMLNLERVLYSCGSGQHIVYSYRMNKTNDFENSQKRNSERRESWKGE